MGHYQATISLEGLSSLKQLKEAVVGAYTRSKIGQLFLANCNNKCTVDLDILGGFPPSILDEISLRRLLNNDNSELHLNAIFSKTQSP